MWVEGSEHVGRGEGGEVSDGKGAARRKQVEREASGVEGAVQSGGKHGEEAGARYEGGARAMERRGATAAVLIFFYSCDLLALLNFCFYVLHYCNILLGF